MDNNETSKEFDVALSFAGEDRQYVREVATALKKKNVKVFYDEFEEADLIGRNLVDHLSEIYKSKARICLMFVSSAYARKPFTRLERQAAQSTAMFTDDPYIVPVRLDDTEIPGLLPPVAYVSGKTPEGLAQLVASKLIMSEESGQVFSIASNSSQRLLVRFNSLIEPDIETFSQVLQDFRHWSEDKLRSIPIELRVPQTIQKQIEEDGTFKQSKSWMSPMIGDEARQQYVEFNQKLLPKFLADTAKGTQTIIACYGFSRLDRMEFVARRYLMTRMIILCRLILDCRLIGMSVPKWESTFTEFGRVWADWVMYGLPYACFLDGEERFLWVDADGRDNCTAITWPSDSLRLYAPSELLLSRDFEEGITDSQFDQFFAVQLLETELENGRGQPLQYFLQYPDRLNLTIRGEWAIETDHYKQHGTSNSGGEPLFESVRKLRDHFIGDGDKKGITDNQKYLVFHRIQNLFRESDQFDSILWPVDS